MRHILENYCLPTMPTRYDSWGPNHIWLHTTLEGPWLQYMIVEVCWDGLWTLSFGLSLSHGHGSWLMCEVTMTPMLAYMPACLGDNNNMVMLYDMVCNGMAWVWYVGAWLEPMGTQCFALTRAQLVLLIYYCMSKGVTLKWVGVVGMTSQVMAVLYYPCLIGHCKLL